MSDIRKVHVLFYHLGRGGDVDNVAGVDGKSIGESMGKDNRKSPMRFITPSVSSGRNLSGECRFL